ncbi:MAG: BamA/TamA family outer membrane protein [Polyangiaceae bacterium]|nr:BamA/TamA family outer membrane protein [Polyangiaceae bacterium]
MRLRWLCFVRAALALALLLIGCKQRPPKVPGETDVGVESVSIEPLDPGKELELSHSVLFDRLGERPDSLIAPGRTWSTFREAEDRRRIEAYWKQRGYFDVVVKDASVTFAEDGRANIVFKVRENERYKVGRVRIQHALPDVPLDDLVDIHEGDERIDLEVFRKMRHPMADRLRVAGYGHANVYVRFYVDETDKLVHVVYFVDAGPKTKIASITVSGNVKVPKEDVIRRSGLEVGAPYTEDLRDRVPRDLLDTGAYAAAFVRVDTDTKFIIPGTEPDTGGELRDEQIDAQGNLVPRKLPEGVNVTIHVVEAPSQTVRVRGGFEIDPSRADTAVTATAWFRNLFGPLHHLVLEGRVGYGYIFDRTSDEPPGVYGEALIRTVHAGVLGRTGDLRTTVRYVGTLYPRAFLHRGTTGVGARTTFMKGMFLEGDLLAFFEKSERFGPFLPEEREALALPSREWAVGPELDVSFIYDGRDHGVEPMRGGYVGLTSRINPLAAGGIADYPFVNMSGDGRGFIPLTPSLSIGLRAFGEWSLLNEGDGIPLGERLFGGGAYGFRGFGAQRLSPVVLRCFEEFCKEVPVGGRSLVESSLELRFLPPQKQYGAVVFGDLGGVSGDLNPFAQGPSFAAGLGARLRLWYLPAAIDFAYRVLHEGEVQGLEDEPFHVFFRIGEAF